MTLYVKIRCGFVCLCVYVFHVYILYIYTVHIYVYNHMENLYMWELVNYTACMEDVCECL